MMEKKAQWRDAGLLSCAVLYVCMYVGGWIDRTYFSKEKGEKEKKYWVGN